MATSLRNCPVRTHVRQLKFFFIGQTGGILLDIVVSLVLSVVYAAMHIAGQAMPEGILLMHSQQINSAQNMYLNKCSSSMPLLVFLAASPFAWSSRERDK